MRWERITEWPLVAVAVLFLGAYGWSTIDPGLPRLAASVCGVVVTASWVIFALDFLVRLALAPLRLLRLVVLLSVVNRTVGSSLRGRVAVYVGGATSFVIFVAALAMLDAERGAPEASITTFGDGLWWAMTTVTTVGYGDLYPVTTTGRFVAAALMLCGIALLGVVTASLASWFLDRVREVEETAQHATQRDVEQLVAEVEALRRELSEGPPRP